MSSPRPKRAYDHRLRELVQETGELRYATKRGVPRSTAARWRSASPLLRPVVTLDVFSWERRQLEREALELRRQVRLLRTLVGLLVALVRAVGGKLAGRRVPAESSARVGLLRAVEHSREVLPLGAALRVLGLSSSRYHAWRRAHEECTPVESDRCPRRAPNQLTAEEIAQIRSMTTSPEYRHVPTSRLAVLGQRMGRVFASPVTWLRLVRERGWRRPRRRVHPDKPTVGLRTERPDETWHVDITLIRLLDGTKAYVHAVIDNFSRRILAFRVAERFAVANAVSILEVASAGAEARASGAPGDGAPPLLLVDGGVENFNTAVDELHERGVLRRVLAQTEITFSNSMIEAFWRSLKHQFLFLNTLDSVAALRRLVAAYVSAHNSQIPHSAFEGQTPDEVYFGTGADVPDSLRAARLEARQRRLEANRELACSACSGPGT